MEASFDCAPSLPDIDGGTFISEIHIHCTVSTVTKLAASFELFASFDFGSILKP